MQAKKGGPPPENPVAVTDLERVPGARCAAAWVVHRGGPQIAAVLAEEGSAGAARGLGGGGKGIRWAEEDQVWGAGTRKGRDQVGGGG